MVLRHNAAMIAPLSPLFVPAHAGRRQRWRNGAGWTSEILSIPALTDDDWAARLSIAEIDAAADYSCFPGVQREQVLLSGDGLELCFADDGGTRRLEPPCGRAGFSGERRIHGRPLGPQVRVFNLMWRPALLDACLMHRPLVGPMLFFCNPSTFWAIHVVGGTAHLTDAGERPPLERGDTALLAAEQGRRFMLDGGADLLLVRFDLDRAAQTIAAC